MLKVEMALSLVIAPAADSGWPVVVEAAQRGYRRHTNWKALHVQRNAASVPNSVSATAARNSVTNSATGAAAFCAPRQFFASSFFTLPMTACPPSFTSTCSTRTNVQQSH